MEKNAERRIKTALIIFVILLIFLVIRIWYIQVICHKELSAAAESQHLMEIVGLDTRGTILDRNLQPLTGGTKEYYYVVNKELKEEEMLDLIDLMESLGARQMARVSSPYFVYRTETFNTDVNRILKQKYGAYVFENRSRYSDEQLACHLLGYLNEDEQRGVSGIELMYQAELEASDMTLNLWADAAGGILRGCAPSLRIGKDEDMTEHSGIVTTVDRRVQYVCEKALRDIGKDGAVLVMEGKTGEVIAWASSPVFNPNAVENYLDEDSSCLVDKVCQGTYAPGSVFKIITAAAALESGKADEKTVFPCKGEVEVGGILISCSTGGEKGHGKIDMTQAMAQSCNCYFAQLGEKTGCKRILKMARRMGLGEKCFDGFPGEKAGNIPANERVGAQDTTNISIGQGELLVTPLQAARVTSVIANGGTLIEPKLVYMEEETLPKEVISEETALTIDGMLEEVMETGTGKGEWDLKVKGKTGTAEAVSGGKKVNNCWFTGYFTIEEKLYVVTVLVENGVSGASTAIPVFRYVYNFLVGNL